ncbi:MAG TPA: histidine kinase dimerization/phosphoacceptor domain -containing protein [Salinarimonas sp.]|nr:histidine kinase dimerization/phosphoacceptor domain -containing protein [Salinarimonas sp.]
MNDFVENMPGTSERTSSERYINAIRQQGGMFVEAVRVTRMPMIVTDAKLPGNPITFANPAFIKLSGYDLDELLGQDPHFMNGEGTDPDAIRRYEEAILEGRDINLEILQYRKDGTPFHSMLFAAPLTDGQGSVTNHFLSYLDITRRVDAEEHLRALTADLERRVAERTHELDQANAALRRLVSEREMLLVEVNHRAKNSLMVAASLLAIQGRRQPDPGVKALFEEAYDRLHAMARVHDLLSKSESAQRVDLARYVTDLCEALRPLTESDGRVRFERETEEGILVEADVAFSLGIILTELVTNAVKYAFPAPRAGTIRLRTRQREDGNVEVTIQDNGIGMASIREGSLGYGLVRSLVRQIDGELDIVNDNGVSINVVFGRETRLTV